MYYYRIENEDIIKYEVNLNEEKLKLIRSEVIENCSKRIHKHYKTTNRPNQYNTDFIRNYNEKYVRTIEYNDIYSQPKDEYEVQYDYLQHHVLVNYIDELLKGNTSVIELIINMDESENNEEKMLINRQREIIHELAKLDDNNLGIQIKELYDIEEKLIKLNKEKELNKNILSINDYQLEVLKCIDLNKVSSISLDTFLEIQSFFQKSTINTVDKELSNILKLEKRKSN